MQTKHTILQICPRLNSGGIERGTVDMAIAVAHAGINSIVISGGGLMVKQLASAGVKHITLPVYQKSPLAILRNGRLLCQIMTQQSINLVHARSRAPIWSAVLALKNLDIPLVTSCHSPHGTGFLKLKKYYNLGIIRGDRVIAISEFIRQYLENNYTIDPNKISTIYRGIDCNDFNPERYTADDILKIKQKYHIPTDKTILLLPGRVTRWKGQDTLIEALHLLKNSKYHAIFVGRIDSDAFYQQCRALITRYQLSQQTQWLPESNHMAAMYAIADMTISTSRKAEAFGRVAVEGQAMKNLVIATHLGAVAETIIPKKTGFSIPPDDAQALAHCIEQCDQLPSAEKTVLCKQARQHVELQFSKQQMLAKTLQLYQSLLPLAVVADRTAVMSQPQAHADHVVSD